MRISHWKESRKLCRFHNKDKGLGVEKEHNKNPGVTAIYKILINEGKKNPFSHENKSFGIFGSHSKVLTCYLKPGC